jgi:hypothetical protein
MDCADLKSIDLFSILEGESQYTLAGIPCNKLYALDNSIDDDMLNTGVLSFSIFSDQNSINIIVRSFVASNGPAGPNVCEEVECTA